MREYKRIKRDGYTPVKDYGRYILFRKENGLRTTILYIDLNQEERAEIDKNLRGTNG